MTNQIKNMFIGLFVVMAGFLIVGIVLFIRPGIGDGEQVVKVHFTDINGINIGTRVLLAGRPIGEVYSIEQIPQAREQPQNQFGQVYFYLVTLHIDSHITIFTTDKITISTTGLLGEKLIDIIPQPFAKKTADMVVTTDTALYAESGDLLTSALNDLASLSESIGSAVNKVAKWIDQYGGDVGSAVQSFGNASTEIAKAFKDFNDLDVINQVQDTIAVVKDTFQHGDNLLISLEEDNFSQNLSQTMANVSDITSSIIKGKGTIGRLIEEDTLYVQVSAAMSKVNHLMDDINNYGLLFWYNKQWLRSREERIATYQQLNNPQAFRYYLDQESASINASLNRLTQLAKRAEMANGSIVDNPDLWKTLKILQDELDALQTSIDYYIQELNNQTP